MRWGLVGCLEPNICIQIDYNCAAVTIDSGTVDTFHILLKDRLGAPTLSFKNGQGYIGMFQRVLCQLFFSFSCINI